jgi:uncharacterized protein (TIGR03085 family)
VTNFAQQERQALCDVFLQVGPGAPTLCEGWATADLAAHLVIRERRPDAMPGALIPWFAGHTNNVLRATRDGSSWEDLVARVRSGPPAAMRLADEQINSVEYFVHHEDVRRAGATAWKPRSLDPAEEAALWGRLRLMGRVLARRAPTGLAVVAPGFGDATLKRGPAVVTLRGKPSELTLLVFGRGSHASIDYAGDELSVERLRHASFGL